MDIEEKEIDLKSTNDADAESETEVVTEPHGTSEDTEDQAEHKNGETAAYPGKNDNFAKIVFDIKKVPSEIAATQNVDQIPVPTHSTDVPAFRMQLGKEEIEKMINDGRLEKVSEGYYKMKADLLKDLKIPTKAVVVDSPSGTKLSKPGPLSKKLKVTKEMTSTPAVQPAQIATVIPSSLPQTIPQVTGSPSLAQPASYIALMPYNQSSSSTSNTPGNTLIAVPVQQNVPLTYPQSIPTFVTLPRQNSTTQPTPTQIIAVSEPSVPVTTSETPVVTLPVDSTPNSKVSTKSVTEPQPSTSRHSLRTRTKTRAAAAAAAAALAAEAEAEADLDAETEAKAKRTQNISVYKPPSNVAVKRKPMVENTKVKKPLKYAKLTKQIIPKSKNTVSDFNSSEEEDYDEIRPKDQKAELSSLFFRKFGESPKKNKSLMDKLHKSIFCDSNSESDHDSDESDLGTEGSEIITGNSKCHTVNCPGPGTFEAYVGPGKTSKISILQSQETKTIKNFHYEIYKVRVTSAGREANTNILIPVPEGYKFQTPKPAEERVEFSHISHQDQSSSSYVSPKFLEKLATTELKLRKYKDQLKVLRGRYIELLQEYANRPQFSTVSDLVGAAAKFLTEDQLVFFLMQLKAGAHNMQGVRYSVREKVLALSIYQKSPETYKWSRKLFNLPSKRVLDQWLEDVGSHDPQLVKKLMYYIYATYNFKIDA